MLHKTLRTIAVLLSFALIGCQAPEKQGYMPPPPKPPPAVPPVKAVAIDPALQSAARQQLEEALRSSDEYIRAHAIEVLKQVNPPDAGPRIVAALGDPSPLVRKAAAFAAGELRVREASDRLNQSIDSAKLPEE